MSIALHMRILALEEVGEDFSEKLGKLSVALELAVANIDSLAVKRAIERPPITIPRPFRCLYDIGMVS